METETRFKPENKLEKNIIDSDIFKSGIKHSKSKGPAHPEKNNVIKKNIIKRLNILFSS